MHRFAPDAPHTLRVVSHPLKAMRHESRHTQLAVHPELDLSGHGQQKKGRTPPMRRGPSCHQAGAGVHSLVSSTKPASIGPGLFGGGFVSASVAFHGPTNPAPGVNPALLNAGKVPGAQRLSAPTPSGALSGGLNASAAPAKAITIMSAIISATPVLFARPRYSFELWEGKNPHPDCSARNAATTPSSRSRSRSLTDLRSSFARVTVASRSGGIGTETISSSMLSSTWTAERPNHVP